MGCGFFCYCTCPTFAFIAFGNRYCENAQWHHAPRTYFLYSDLSNFWVFDLVDLAVAKSTLIMIDEPRRLRRESIDCQIVRDSILPRGLATPYLIRYKHKVVGYAGVWSRYNPGRVMEFYLLPEAQDLANDAFQALVEVSGAHEMEAQTNIPLMDEMLTRHCQEITDENILFSSGALVSEPRVPGSHDHPIKSDSKTHHYVFRHRRRGDSGPDGTWVIEMNHMIVAAGNILRHYNPPFGDIFMEVLPEHRRIGIGSFLVKNLSREASRAGLKACARCEADNIASKRTLESGGMIYSGKLRVGKIV